MNHSMWKKWRDFRFEALTEGDKDPTIEGLIAGMTGAAMNLIPTLTNMTKYIDFIMKPDDPKKSPEENDLNKQTVRNALEDLDENAKLLLRNYKFIRKYIKDEYGFTMHGKDDNDDSDKDKKKDENLIESGQWVIRIKKGKRVKKLECPPGFKVDSSGKRCKKQTTKDIKTGKKAARKRMKKMKSQMGKIQKKRAKSLKKRASMNI